MLRFIYIIGVLIKYALLYLLMRLKIYRFPPDKTLKRLFEEAGGSFIKFGQLLALRVDVLPPQYALGMFDLLDHVKPFSYADVKEIFLEDLGATPEKIFKDFQQEPFASGSFGQVHAAKLDDDTIIAVKIMRPGIDEMVQADFLVVNFAAFMADMFIKVAGFSWQGFAKEFKKWTLQELDYIKEADNAERLRRSLGPERLIVIPKIYHNLTTRRILTQEYIDGFPLTRVLRGLKEKRITYEGLLELGVDIKKTPRTLTYEILYQYFFDGFFHADLHPGNIILLQNNKIGLIDFGIMGEFIPSNKTSFIKWAKCIGEFKVREATTYFADVISDDLKQMIQSAFPASTDQKRIDGFMKILIDHMSQEVEKKAMASLQDLRDMKTDHVVLYLRLLGTAESYKLKMPQDMAIFIKAFSTMGLVSKELDFEFTLTDEFRDFFKKHPEETIPNDYATKPIQRISRDRAMEKLNNWLAYLLERRPEIYHLVNSYITQYNRVDQ